MTSRQSSFRFVWCWSTGLVLLLAAAASSKSPASSPATQPAAIAYREIGECLPTDPGTRRRLDLRATDLGVSFPYQRPGGPEELVFLFGDTHPYSAGPDQGRFDEDAIGLAPAALPKPGEVNALRWLTRGDGQFLSLLVPREDFRAMEVPLDGVQVAPDRVLLFFNADYDTKAHRHDALVCVEARDGRFDELTPRFRQRTNKFLNVSMSRDPREPSTVWVWGTGPYRRSPIYLARASIDTLGDFNAWQFRSGDGWGDREADATPVVDGRCGELSVRFVPAASSWVMLYQRRMTPDKPTNGIYARFATDPTKPWGPEVALLEPDASRGIGFTQFMHARTRDIGYCDGLAGDGRPDINGDAYGPYLVPEWCYRDEHGDLHLVHTLPTWNPYRPMLMDAVMSTRAEATLPLSKLPKLEATDGPLAVEKTTDMNGDRSATWVVDAEQRWLGFEMSGQQTLARLFAADGNCLRESSGRRADDGQGLKVRWHIGSLAGQRVRLTLRTRAAPTTSTSRPSTRTDTISAPRVSSEP